MANPISAVDPEFNDLLQQTDADFRQAVIENLPKLAVKMHKLEIQYSNKNLLKQTELAKPDEKISALQAQAWDICDEAVKQIHTIETRIKLLTFHKPSGGVVVEDMLDRALNLTKDLRCDLEAVSSNLSNFHGDRSNLLYKMNNLYHAQCLAALAEFDRKAISQGVKFFKMFNMIISIYTILKANWQHLMPDESKKNGDAVGASYYN